VVCPSFSVAVVQQWQHSLAVVVVVAVALLLLLLLLLLLCGTVSRVYGV
jgi:hypothetical protein